MIKENALAGIMVGCAGWSIPGTASDRFPEAGSHLERYSAVLPAVEINSSFYRPHRPATYARWRDSVPESFRFSVKLPKEITHVLRLRPPYAALEKFVAEVNHLERKLDCLLVQLPPSLRYEPAVAQEFFQVMRSLIDVDIICEPRHASWFAQAAAQTLAQCKVSYVRADPPPAPIPGQGPAAATVYLRLHGTPEIYHSAYADDSLDRIVTQIECDARAGRRVWCVFDNTASGAAVPNALSLLARLHRTSM